KSLMPDCCIGVDVIVGFPGETREDFLDTYNFLNEMDISYLDVFTYSERQNTIAAQMEGSVPGAKRSDRSNILHVCSVNKRSAFYEKQLGKVGEVMFESDFKDAYMHGFYINYVNVGSLYDPLLVNEIVQVKFPAITGQWEVGIE